MRKVFVLIIGLGICVLSGRGQDLERRFQQEFDAPAERVVLKVTRGTVDVVSGPAGGRVGLQVLLRLQRKDVEGAGRATVLERLTPDLLAPFRRDVDAAFKGMTPSYKADLKMVELAVRDSRPVVIDSDPSLQMIIEVRVTVPAGLALDIRGVETGVTMGDYAGDVDIRTDSGSYFIKSVSGNLTARSDGGSLTVGEVGGRSDLRTAAGGILAGRLRGPARLATSNGSIEVQHAYDALRVRGDDADIILNLSNPLPRSVDLETSAGRITVNVDQNLPLTVDAATRLLGKVRARGLPLVVRKGDYNQSSLMADLNGGGEALHLRTLWGSIVLVGREPLDG